MNSAKNISKIALSYYGAKKYGDKHKKLVDTFNKVKPNGEIARYEYDWCAIAWTAWQILGGMSKNEVPMSYNVGTLVKQAQAMGLWVENDAHVPKFVGEGLVYNWSDSGKGQCDSGADHIGLIYKVDKKYLYVIEGNMSTTSKVGKRAIPINGRYIRGFITPHYRAHDIDYMAKKLAWKEDTHKSKYAYKGGQPRKNFRDVMKSVYPKLKNFSGCHTFVGVTLKQCEFATMPQTWSGIFKYLRKRFTEVDYDLKSSQLRAGDIMVYKNSEGRHHIWIIVEVNGKKKIAEANQNRYYGHINGSLSKALKKHNGIWLFRANY